MPRWPAAVRHPRLSAVPEPGQAASRRYAQQAVLAAERGSPGGSVWRTRAGPAPGAARFTSPSAGRFPPQTPASRARRQRRPSRPRSRPSRGAARWQARKLAQDRLGRVPAATDDQLIAPGRTKAMSREEPLCTQPAVLLGREQNIAARHRIPRHHPSTVRRGQPDNHAMTVCCLTNGLNNYRK